MQLGLFDTLHAPPVIQPVDRDGPVVQGDVDETLVLKHPRYAWDRATIELHRHNDGLWMWATQVICDGDGGGYKVGPKWGKFAESRDDALFYAAAEIRRRLDGRLGAEATKILTWLETL